MKRSLTSIWLILAFFAVPGVGHAMIVTIDFDSPAAATGVYDPGDTVVTVGGLTVSIAQGSLGNPRNGGTILNPGSSVGGGFSGNYFTSASTSLNQNDGRLDLAFSIPITGLITLDANYDNTSANDFRIIDLLTGLDVCPVINDGPNVGQIMCDLGSTQTTELRFRDSNVKSVEIDNLVVNAIPVPPAVWLFGSALGLLAWMKRKAT